MSVQKALVLLHVLTKRVSIRTILPPNFAPAACSTQSFTGMTSDKLCDFPMNVKHDTSESEFYIQLGEGMLTGISLPIPFWH